ncbi:MAG: hypothetical protein RSB50_06250 [Cetobacterium sp.]
MGRPKKLKDKDYEEVEKLARFGLTKEMIADYLDYSYSTMYEDKRFSEVYKRGYAELGKRVRTTLLSKIEDDTTANIYLDKVINKTTEKQHDDNIEIKRATLELEQEKVSKGISGVPEVKISFVKAEGKDDKAN